MEKRIRLIEGNQELQKRKMEYTKGKAETFSVDFYY